MQHTTVYAKKNGLSHKTTLNTGYKYKSGSQKIPLGNFQRPPRCERGYAFLAPPPTIYFLSIYFIFIVLPFYRCLIHHI
jgi:hypothetical protein